jgi:hypothetical protein
MKCINLLPDNILRGCLDVKRIVILYYQDNRAARADSSQKRFFFTRLQRMLRAVTAAYGLKKTAYRIVIAAAVFFLYDVCRGNEK